MIIPKTWRNVQTMYLNREITLQLENYFMLSDRHRAMRMDIDGMSYEV